MFKKLLLVLLLVGFWPGSSALAKAEYTLPEAINEAGRQRMLTQRILKSYTQIGLGLQEAQSRRDLSQAVDLFDSQLKRLRVLDDDRAINRRLDRIEALWEEYREIVTAPVSRDGASILVPLSDDLLHESHQLVLMLQDRAGFKSAELINISGRQRMLSQRLALYYMMNSWGVQSQSIQSQASQARNEFRGALEHLRGHTLDNLEIAQQLSVIDAEWSWFNSAMEESGSERFDLVVLNSSEQLLESLEYLTALYELESTPPTK